MTKLEWRNGNATAETRRRRAAENSPQIAQMDADSIPSRPEDTRDFILFPLVGLSVTSILCAVFFAGDPFFAQTQS